MTDYSELVKRLRACAALITSPDLFHEAADAIEAQQAEIEAVWKDLTPRLLEEQGCELNLYDQEEVHEDCTVVIWKNSVTGEESIGWYENEKEETNGHE